MSCDQRLLPLLDKLPEHLHRPPSRIYIKDRDGDAFCGKESLDCALGQNPYGCPPACADWLAWPMDFALHPYPGYPYEAERRAVAARWKDHVSLRIEDIRLGTGSIGIINTLNKMLIQRGSKALGMLPQFPDFARNVQSYGGVYRGVQMEEMRGYLFESERFLQEIHGDAQVVYLDNPNNPTGQRIPLETIDAIARKTEALGVFLMVDEAYGDYLPDQDSAVTLTRQYSNLMVVRSLSKGFGLAGIRVGYLVCSPGWTRYYDRVDIPFTIHSLGQRLMREALSDTGHTSASAAAVRESKTELLRRCGPLRPAATDLRVPITLLTHPDPHINLWSQFKELGILTVTGADFQGLDARSVRIVQPRNPERLWDALEILSRRAL